MTAPLSLALFSHLASPVSPTGAERSGALLAQGLAGRRHRVLLVAPGPSPLDAELREAGVEVMHVPARMCWLAYHDPRPWPEALARWARYAWPGGGGRGLSRLLSQRRPQAAHVNALPHLRAAAAAARRGIPVVWHVREILPEGPRRRWLAARLRRHATRIVAVSRAVASWIEEEGLGERLSVVPNGVSIPASPPDREGARRRLGLPEEGCLVGLFGQLRPHKGALDFVRAARIALPRAPAARFLIAGPGPAGHVAEVGRAIESGPGEDRFHLLGPQPSASDLLAAADVVCLATRTPDPLPRAVLEAMAHGRPVAAFASGGTAEMVEEGRTGLLVPPGDIQGLGDAIARLARDEALRARMGAAGRERARQAFSPEGHVDRMEEILREASAAAIVRPR